jgi:hypothetical protein
VRVLVRSRRHALLYQGRVWALLLTLALGAIGAVAGVVIGHIVVGVAVAGAALLAWLGYAMRVTQLVPTGPHGDGPAPPGGAGVREPRQPLPISPAGTAARQRYDDEPPGQAVALA